LSDKKEQFGHAIIYHPKMGLLTRVLTMRK